MAKQSENQHKFKFSFSAITAFVVVIFFMLFSGYIFINQFSASDHTSEANDNDAEIVSSKVLDYLNKKYGNQGFKIEEVRENYTYSGIIQKNYIGYQVNVSSSEMDDTFLVVTSGEEAKNTVIDYEEFVEAYYKSEVSKDFQDDYGWEFQLSIDDKRIPNNHGEIPSIDDMINFNAIEYINIVLNDPENKPHDGDTDLIIQYLNGVTDNLIMNLNITQNFSYTYIRAAEENSCQYYVLVEESQITYINLETKESITKQR